MKTTFLIDGFNLYHSVDEYFSETGNMAKWLDVEGLCRSLLPSMARDLGERMELASVYYFTARNSHLQRRDGSRVQRQAIYLKALAATEVTIVHGAFKKVSRKCHECGAVYSGHEEKKTGVAIACKALELCFSSEVDAIVLVTGDTDQVPPFEYIGSQFPTIHRIIAFPRGRENRELSRVADIDYTFDGSSYSSNQLPQTIPLSSGKEITKPSVW